MDASTAILTEHLSLTQPFVFSFLHGVLAEQALQAGLFSFNIWLAGAYLILGWDKEVLLAKGVHSGVLLRNLHFDRIHKACPLQLGHLGSHGSTE